MTALRSASIALLVTALITGCTSKSPTAPSASPSTTSAPVTATATAPDLTGITPTRGDAGATIVATLTGTGFTAGATLEISGNGVTASEIEVVNSTSITARLTVDAAAEFGARDIRVKTANGTSEPQAFTVEAPDPVVANVTPSFVVAGTTTTITINGTSFVPGSTTVTVSGDGVTIANVTGPLAAATGKSITVSLRVDLNATPGQRTVTVTTPGGSTTSTFNINAPLPRMESFTARPLRITRGESSTLSWTGISLATSCNINVGIGNVPCADSSIVVTPTVSTEYMLSAIGPGGREWMYVTVAVEDPLPPPPSGSQTFNFSGTVQTFTVPAGVTTITIQADGAGGGSGANVTGGGGSGARVTGTFGVTAGSILKVIVGEGGKAGTTGFSNAGGGGGGGSFVFDAANNLMIVAGGGGGGGNNIFTAATSDATFTLSGAANAAGTAGGSGGAGGPGDGNAIGGVGGGGGGGTTSAGGNAVAGGAQGGGVTTAFGGGAGGTGANGGGAGGFGGGGGGGKNAGGGGGGYSGGAGGESLSAGGGGTFNAGNNPSTAVGPSGGAGMGAGNSGQNGTDGRVVISW